jgi:excisionase family DNA binding protein
MDKAMMKLTEAAKELGVSRNTIYGWIAKADVPFPGLYRLGGHWRVNREIFEAWLATRGKEVTDALVQHD